MQTFNDENSPAPRSFTDCLQRLHDQEVNPIAAIPNIHEWMQYWNDDESYAANLRNIRHWMERVRQQN